jgi:glycosyltransferase involved in cell wall biosynthesis
MSPRRPAIAYLVSRYPAISHTFILREVRRLRRLGIDVRVASVNVPDRAPDGLTAEEREEAASTFVVKRAGLLGVARAHARAVLTAPARYGRTLVAALRLSGGHPRRALYGLFYFIEAVVVSRWMADHRLSHLHVHFLTPAATVGLLVSRLAPVTLSFTAHGPDEFYEASGHAIGAKVAEATFVCCIAHYTRSQLMKLSDPAHWSKLEVVRLGVDAGVFTPPGERTAGTPFEILCVGRLVPAKGQHVLLAAVRRLVASGRPVRLRLVGDGPARQSLEQAARDAGMAAHVVFEGAVNQDRIRQLYASADVFALASFAEGVPVVLMEAMAMEIPCVATRVCGIPELIRDGEDGILVAPSDDAELAEALGRLMDDPTLGRTLGRAGRARVRDRYDLDRNTARLAEVFRSHLAFAR